MSCQRPLGQLEYPGGSAGAIPRRKDSFAEILRGIKEEVKQLITISTVHKV
jgi:hypothetical protein